MQQFKLQIFLSNARFYGITTFLLICFAFPSFLHLRTVLHERLVCFWQTK